MIKKFKFFEGIIENTYVYDLGNYEFHQTPRRNLRAFWTRETEEELNYNHSINAEAELTRILTEEIVREMDENITRELTRRINGGDNLDYLNRWLDIGENNNRA